ncbi:hypothetical protein B0675_27855 [Streptomyces sp. M41(2017)]|nr:hypothetical protein B0675_27855 [Streptomyces sp. M41(2017)]
MPAAGIANRSGFDLGRGFADADRPADQGLAQIIDGLAVGREAGEVVRLMGVGPRVVQLGPARKLNPVPAGVSGTRTDASWVEHLYSSLRVRTGEPWSAVQARTIESVRSRPRRRPTAGPPPVHPLELPQIAAHVPL